MADSDPADELEQRLDAEYAPAWRPEPGDKLIGAVTAIRTWTGPFGTYPIVVIEPADGSPPVSVHAFRQVLASQLAEIRPMIGELIGVKYEGRVTDGSGPDYHSYRVEIDR